MSTDWRKWWWLPALVLYFPLILADPRVDWDEAVIIGPLSKVESLSDYLNRERHPDILDLQPIRDLSYFIDLFIRRHLHFGSFHLSNFIIGLGVLLVTRQIFRLVLRSQAWADVGLWFLAVHPIALSSMAWIAARKHLLSVFFILMATVFWLRPDTRRRKATVFYFLSVFSNPITLLWPVWATYYSRTQRRMKEDRAVLGFLGAGAVMVGILNWVYYQRVYPQQLGITKVVGFVPGLSLLAVGRYFFNLIFPFFVSAVYWVDSPRNGLGLLLLGLFFAAIVKLKAWNLVKGWLLLSFLPILTVTLKMTHVFVLDVYSLLPLVVITLVILLIFKTKVPNVYSAPFRAHPFAPGYVILACTVWVALFLQSWAWSKDWLSAENLWVHSAEREPTAYVLTRLASLRLSQKNFSEAEKAEKRLEIMAPNFSDIPVLWSRLIYEDSRISPAKKLERLLERRYQNPWYEYYLAATYGALGQFHQAQSLLWHSIITYPDVWGTQQETVAAEAFYLCTVAHEADCELKMRRLPKRKGWRDGFFTSKFNGLMDTKRH